MRYAPHKNQVRIKKRAITQNLGKQELRLMCTALPFDEIYPPTKFHNHSLHSLGDMHQTKHKYEKKQRAITKKLSKQELWFICTALPLDAIYLPTKFHNHSKYSFGDMDRTKFKYERKQRAITQKISKQELQFMCTALPLMKCIHPQNFITIASIVLEIRSGQNSSMKINKGQ